MTDKLGAFEWQSEASSGDITVSLCCGCGHTHMCLSVLQVILKPAEATPLTALALAELGRRAGLPPGVLNIVVGEAKKIGLLFKVPCLHTSRLVLLLLATWAS